MSELPFICVCIKVCMYVRQQQIMFCGLGVHGGTKQTVLPHIFVPLYITFLKYQVSETKTVAHYGCQHIPMPLVRICAVFFFSFSLRYQSQGLVFPPGIMKLIPTIGQREISHLLSMCSGKLALLQSENVIEYAQCKYAFVDNADKMLYCVPQLQRWKRQEIILNSVPQPQQNCSEMRQR